MKQLKTYTAVLVFVILYLNISILISFVSGFNDGFTSGFNEGQTRTITIETKQEDTMGEDDKMFASSIIAFNFKYKTGKSTVNEITFNGTQLPISITGGVVEASDKLLEKVKGTKGYLAYKIINYSLGVLALPFIIACIWMLVLVIKLLYSVFKTKLFNIINLKRISTVGFILLGIELLGIALTWISYYCFGELFQFGSYRLDYWSAVQDSNLILAIIILSMNELLRIAITMKEEQELTI